MGTRRNSTENKQLATPPRFGPEVKNGRSIVPKMAGSDAGQSRKR